MHVCVDSRDVTDRKLQNFKSQIKFIFFSLFIFYSFTKQKIFFFPSQRRADLKGGKKLNQRRIRAHGKKKLCTASPIPFHPPKTKPAWPIHSTPKRIPRFWWVFMSFTILHFHLPSVVLNKCRFLPTVQTHTHTHKRKTVVESNTEMGAAILTYK